MIEKKAGLGVHLHYGTRNTGSVTGVDPSKNADRTFVWTYDPDFLLDNRNVLPKGSSVVQVNMTGAGSVKVGGTAVAGATPTAPVEAEGAVEWTGAAKGDKLLIRYIHIAKQGV